MAEEGMPELGEYARHGFRLKHLDDLMVGLYHEDEELGVFSQLGATADSIQSECTKHLDAKHGGKSSR